MLVLYVWMKRMRTGRIIGILQPQKSKQIIKYSTYFFFTLLDVVGKHPYVLSDNFPDLRLDVIFQGKLEV